MTHENQNMGLWQQMQKCKCSAWHQMVCNFPCGALCVTMCNLLCGTLCVTFRVVPFGIKLHRVVPCLSLCATFRAVPCVTFRVAPFSSVWYRLQLFVWCRVCHCVQPHPWKDKHQTANIRRPTTVQWYIRCTRCTCKNVRTFPDAATVSTESHLETHVWCLCKYS